jgi:hypothetical protein
VYRKTPPQRRRKTDGDQDGCRLDLKNRLLMRLDISIGEYVVTHTRTIQFLINLCSEIKAAGSEFILRCSGLCCCAVALK